MLGKSEFVQRVGKLDRFTFLSLVVFNPDSLAYESLSDLTTRLELDYGVEITKQSLDERFNSHADCCPSEKKPTLLG